MKTQVVKSIIQKELKQNGIGVIQADIEILEKIEKDNKTLSLCTFKLKKENRRFDLFHNSEKNKYDLMEYKNKITEVKKEDDKPEEKPKEPDFILVDNPKHSEQDEIIKGLRERLISKQVDIDILRKEVEERDEFITEVLADINVAYSILYASVEQLKNDNVTKTDMRAYSNLMETLNIIGYHVTKNVPLIEQVEGEVIDTEIVTESDEVVVSLDSYDGSNFSYKDGEFSTLDESLEVNLYILKDDIKSMLEGMIGSDKLGHKKAGKELLEYLHDNGWIENDVHKLAELEQIVSLSHDVTDGLIRILEFVDTYIN